MAKLKSKPRNYAQAAAYLAGRDRVKLGNNTWLENINGGIGVRLHNTIIVWFHEDGKTTLHTGGYYSVTTKDRINAFITGHVYQHAYQWRYQPSRLENAYVPFEDGMDVIL